MVVIAEIPDGSNGGDPNKNPQEVRKIGFESLPDAVSELCVARISVCLYPVISSLSTALRRLVTSPELYAVRSELDMTERFLYALIAFYPGELPRWHILYRRNHSLRLRRVDSLPPMPYGSAVVTIGREIYVIGGWDGQRNTSDVTVIDCRSHTHRSLPRMKVARCRAAAGVIGGMIYVIGGCEMRLWNWIEAFNLSRQEWIEITGPIQPGVSRLFVTYAVMEEKIYTLDTQGRCRSYELREGGEQVNSSGVGGNELRRLWHASSCVVDDMLYAIDPLRILGQPIVVYDPKDGVWRPVYGVLGLLPALYLYGYESRMANLDGKLVILVGNQSQLWDYDGPKTVWCSEISLERRQGGDIWGRLESAHLVLTSLGLPYIELCRTVTV